MNTYEFVCFDGFGHPEGWLKKIDCVDNEDAINTAKDLLFKYPVAYEKIDIYCENNFIESITY